MSEFAASRSMRVASAWMIVLHVLLDIAAISLLCLAASGPAYRDSGLGTGLSAAAAAIGLVAYAARAFDVIEVTDAWIAVRRGKRRRYMYWTSVTQYRTSGLSQGSITLLNSARRGLVIHTSFLSPSDREQLVSQIESRLQSIRHDARQQVEDTRFSLPSLGGVIAMVFGVFFIICGAGIYATASLMVGVPETNRIVGIVTACAGILLTAFGLDGALQKLTVGSEEIVRSGLFRKTRIAYADVTGITFGSRFLHGEELETCTIRAGRRAIRLNAGLEQYGPVVEYVQARIPADVSARGGSVRAPLRRFPVGMAVSVCAVVGVAGLGGLMELTAGTLPARVAVLRASGTLVTGRVTDMTLKTEEPPYYSVTTEYEAGGKRYTDTSKAGMTATQTLSVGGSARLYCAPADPSDCTLEQADAALAADGMRRGGYHLLEIGLILLSTWTLPLAMRRRQSLQNQGNA